MKNRSSLQKKKVMGKVFLIFLIFIFFRNVRKESRQIVALVFWFWLRNLFRSAISYRHDQFALKNNQRQAQPTVTTVDRNDEVQFLDKFLNFFDCMMLKKSPSRMNAEKLFLCILSHNIIFVFLSLISIVKSKYDIVQVSWGGRFDSSVFEVINAIGVE